MATPSSRSAEYCTTTVPVMTPGVSARDSQRIREARTVIASLGGRKDNSSVVNVSVPSMETDPDCTVHS